jgi:hypothetical protein
MVRWEYCRLDVIGDHPDGPFVAVNYFQDPPAAERVLFQDPPPEYTNTITATAIITLGATVDRLGSEGWEAVQINEDGTRWFFKRTRGD